MDLAIGYDMTWRTLSGDIYPFFMGTQKPQSNGPLFSNNGDRYTVRFDTARRGLGGLRPAHAPPRCTIRNSPPINSQCTNFILFDVAL